MNETVRVALQVFRSPGAVGSIALRGLVETRLIESLLNEDESASLDFKRDQYAFEGAPDAVKGELLKDILAFANSWRRSGAYILIGVNEVRGGRSTPVGVQEYLDDARLQQFVSSKTNRPVDFSYEAVSVDQMQIGVVHISLQERPLYLEKDFGRLSRHVVYVRRGSSTAIASPDEVSKMRDAPNVVMRKPRLSLCARVSRSDPAEIVLAITNARGAGPARAPHLLFRLPRLFHPSMYGLDGNGSDGLPRVDFVNREWPLLIF